jgi:hypothetical protein
VRILIPEFGNEISTHDFLPMRRAPRLLITIFASFVLATNRTGAGERSSVPWEKWQPMIGVWKAEGKGSPGEGHGSFSFAYDLQNRVILRKSHTDYPASEGRPAFAHDDLLVIYADEASHRFRGDYFDNEDHVIRYTAEFSPDGKTLTFVSDPAPSQPAFRLTYTMTEPTILSIKFEIAAPTAPAQYKVYVEGFARKS